MIGTFGSFTQARLGIYAAYSGLSVTGNNISNINTTGYTRQKLDQTSFYAGGSDRYASAADLRIGNGALCTGVSQLRDPYLDIRYRNEMASVGAMDTKLAGLEEIQRVLDEVGDGDDAFGILEAQMNDILTQLHQLQDQTGLAEYDIQVRSSAEILTKQFNSYANQLSEIYENNKTNLHQDIETINHTLNSIRDLNNSIRKADIHGTNALELKDERNMLIDKLSSYMKIDVNYTMEDIGGGTMIEKLTIRLDNANPDPNATQDGVETDCSVLVDGYYATQLSIPETITGWQAVRDSDGNLQKNADGTIQYEKKANIPNDNYTIQLGPLKDSKDRLQYSTKSETSFTTEYGGSPSASKTDPTTGVITITTYEATKATEPKKSGVWTDDPATHLYEKAGGPDGATTADPKEAVQLPVYKKTVYTQTPSREIQLADNDLYGALQSRREMLTEAGEFTSQGVVKHIDPNAATKRGIPYYQKALDLLANQFAATFNEANTPNTRKEIYETYKDAAGVERYKLRPGCDLASHQFTYQDPLYPDDPDKTLTISADLVDIEQFKTVNDINGNNIYTQIETLQQIHLSTENLGHGYVKDYDLGQAKGGVLFSSNGDTDNPSDITAANISISASWAKGPLIVNSWAENAGSTDSSNISHMIVLMSEKMNYDPTVINPEATSSSMFEGNFNEMWINTGSVLGNDIKSTGTLLDTYYATSVELDTSRDSASSVDLNDEAMNLMQYSKSYNAACRLMTTIDSVLDKLINGTAV